MFIRHGILPNKIIMLSPNYFVSTELQMNSDFNLPNCPSRHPIQSGIRGFKTNSYGFCQLILKVIHANLDINDCNDYQTQAILS